MTTDEMTAIDERLARIEERLQGAEDRESIVRVLYILGHTIDYGDHDRWLDCFTEDCVFQMVEVSETERVSKVRHEGRPALAAFIPGHTYAPRYFHKHLVSDPVVEVRGDTAHCESYMTRVDKGPDGPFLWSIGRYIDEFRRCEDGAWRLASRTIEAESRAVPVKASDIGSR